MLITKTYHNASRVPDGIYRNKDLYRDSGFYCRVDHDENLWLADCETASRSTINKEIYFRPSYLPVPFMHDYRLGSAWLGWYLPTASYQFTVSGDKIAINTLDRDLDIHSYLDIFHAHVRTVIKGIYDRHHTVCLHYSGGIDSLVLLSYIMALDLLPRTHLVYFRNLTQGHRSDVSFNNADMLSAIRDVRDRLSKQALGFDMIDITLQDVADRANQLSWSDLTCYATSTVMSRYPHMAHIHGHLGNSTLLHYHYIHDELVLVQNNRHDFERIQQSNKDAYGCYLTKYAQPETDKLVRLCDRHFGPKLYRHLGNNYHPLSDTYLLDLVRKLHFRDCSHLDVIDVRFAREILQRNVGGQLDQYVTRGCQSETNALVDMKLPMRLLNADVLEIITDDLHHSEGLSWLHHERNCAVQTGEIPINSLVSFLAQKRLRDMIKDSQKLG